MTAVGAGGLAALTGGAAASNTNLEGMDAGVVRTDDGQINYIAFGGRLRCEWDGLDEEAQYGEYTIQTRVEHGEGWSSWKDHGTASGPLGDDPNADSHDGDGVFEEGEKNTSETWGGDNDSNSGTGTDGFFQFRFGSANGQKDYAIAYDNEKDVGTGAKAVPNHWSAERFEPAGDDGDGDVNVLESTVQLRALTAVYSEDPSTDGATALVKSQDMAKFSVTVENRPKSSTTGGEIDGIVNADES